MPDGREGVPRRARPSGMRAFLPTVILAGGWLLVSGAAHQRPVPLARPLRAMPLALAGFSGEERSVPPDEQQVAGMSDYIYRIFSRDTTAVFSVYVGYYESQATGRTIHSPKNCLPGAGWEALQSGTEDVASDGGMVTVNRYLLANGRSQALVLYWY